MNSDPRYRDYDFHWQMYTDGTDYYRVCFGEEVGKPGRFLGGDKYSTTEGWMKMEAIGELPFELCRAYWAPSQGGECDLPKDHQGSHHV